jgi:hypothetical protein
MALRNGTAALYKYGDGLGWTRDEAATTRERYESVTEVCWPEPIAKDRLESADVRTIDRR